MTGTGDRMQHRFTCPACGALFWSSTLMTYQFWRIGPLLVLIRRWHLWFQCPGQVEADGA